MGRGNITTVRPIPGKEVNRAVRYSLKQRPKKKTTLAGGQEINVPATRYGAGGQLQNGKKTLFKIKADTTSKSRGTLTGKRQK